LRTAFLWLHVISGVIWIGTSAVTTVAANALTFNTDEFREFVSKAIPTIDRVNICAALALLITGLVNFLLLATPVAFDLPSMFVVVLGLKVILFAAMAVMTYALRYVRAAVAGIVAQLTPVAAIAMGWLFLGEHIAGLALFGAALTLAGVTWGAWLASSFESMSLEGS